MSEEQAVQKPIPRYPRPATVYRAEPVKPWTAQLDELLAQAAALGARHGIEADAFMQGAWAAFIDARPASASSSRRCT